jgi:peroxiredoxin
MFHARRFQIVLIVAALAALAGCQSSDRKEHLIERQSRTVNKPIIAQEDIQPAAEVTPAQQSSPQPAEQPAAPKTKPKSRPQAAKAAASKPQAPPPPSTIPKVIMSQSLRANCLVKVGDTMPEAELPDLDGTSRASGSLYGGKLTVVCLWTIGKTVRSRHDATYLLRDLMNEVAAPFGSKGVQVVAVNVGDPPEEVRKRASSAGATFPNLLDAKGGLLAKAAKDRQMPRTYLLDAQGRILWFDVEYSHAMRHDLAQAIQVVLKAK